jgi:hypothetical protein
MATEASNLIDLILRLLKDPAALAEFEKNPDAVLASCGATNVSPEDVHDALVLANDDHDDDDGKHDNGRHDNGGHDNGGHHHVPPPPHPHSGESSHDAAVRYIKEYVTNNYVDDRDTNVDNSVNQQIHTDGGDVDQFIRTTSSTASGDGAVSAGGDIRDSAVTTGNGNQIGDDNIRGDGNVAGDGNHVVSGDHNTTAFGTGDANSSSINHASIDDGSALSVGATASGEQHNTDDHTVNDTDFSNRLDVDGSFNNHEETTTDSNNHGDATFTTDSHEDTVNHVGSDSDVHVNPVL